MLSAARQRGALRGGNKTEMKGTRKRKNERQSLKDDRA